MKKLSFLLILFVLSVMMVGCATNPTTDNQGQQNTPSTTQPVVAGAEIESAVQASESDQSASPIQLNQDYPESLSLRNQLIVGTFRLEETPLAITSEQASELVTLWQLLRTLTRTDSSNQMETEAVMVQIQEAMTSEQLIAIQEMRLTNADNQALLESLGIATQGSGIGGQGNGQGKNMTEEEKAARRATQGVTESQAGAGGNSGARAALDKLIELLKDK